MKVGSKWQLYIPADLAYGANPPPGSPITPNAPLIFDLELLDVKEAASTVLTDLARGSDPPPVRRRVRPLATPTERPSVDDPSAGGVDPWHVFGLASADDPRAAASVRPGRGRDAGAVAAPTRRRSSSSRSEVRPLLVERCQACHGPAKRRGTCGSTRGPRSWPGARPGRRSCRASPTRAC